MTLERQVGIKMITLSDKLNILSCIRAVFEAMLLHCLAQDDMDGVLKMQGNIKRNKEIVQILNDRKL